MYRCKFKIRFHFSTTLPNSCLVRHKEKVEFTTQASETGSLAWLCRRQVWKRAHRRHKNLPQNYSFIHSIAHILGHLWTTGIPKYHLHILSNTQWQKWIGWQFSRWTFQATRMNGGFGEGTWSIKPDQMALLSYFFVLLLMPLFNTIVYPYFKRYNLLTALQKVSIGFICSVIAYTLAGIIELQLEVHLLVYYPFQKYDFT